MDIYTTPIATATGFQRCAHTTPSPRRGQVLFRYNMNGVHLFCHIDDATNKLAAAYIRDVPMLEVIQDDDRHEIENAYVRQEIRLKLQDEYRSGLDSCERSR